MRHCTGDGDIGARCSATSPGDVLGELALVDTDATHTATALCGDQGATLLCIDRALFRRFTDLPAGRAPATAHAQAAAALRTAFCRRVLCLPPAERTEADVRALVAFLRGLQARHLGFLQATSPTLRTSSSCLSAQLPSRACEAQLCHAASGQRLSQAHRDLEKCYYPLPGFQAFEALPHELMLRVAKGLELHRVPQNAVVCEEDEPGDCMFVVAAGACTLRAVPPQAMARSASLPDAGSMVMSTQTLTGTQQRRRRRVQLGPEEQVFSFCCSPHPHARSGRYTAMVATAAFAASGLALWSAASSLV